MSGTAMVVGTAEKVSAAPVPTVRGGASATGGRAWESSVRHRAQPQPGVGAVHPASGASVVIAIPFLDRDRSRLEQAIRSVFAQTRTDWHLLLVADEDCHELCAELRRIDDDRVTVLADGRNLGLAARLNQITQWCPPGIPLMRMDDDDLMHPERVERQLAALDGADAVVSSRGIVMDEHNQVVGLRRGGASPKEGADFLTAGVVLHPSVVASRDWFVANPYDESMSGGEDTELWMRSAPHTRFVTLDEPLLFYRIARQLSIAKDARASKLHRRALRWHGPALAGRARTAGRLLRSVVSLAAFVVLVGLGRGDFVYATRYERLRPAEQARLQTLLDQVSRYPVPGWDGHEAGATPNVLEVAA